MKLIEPTQDEIANGWDAESLTAYVAEREKASLKAADWSNREVPKPQVAVRKSPFRWRR